MTFNISIKQTFASPIEQFYNEHDQPKQVYNRNRAPAENTKYLLFSCNCKQ